MRTAIVLGMLTLAVLTAASSGRADQPADQPAVKWDVAAARHLLSRTSFASPPEEAARLAAMPLARAVDELLQRASQAQPPARPEWVREVWVNTNRRWSDMSAEEYLIVLRRTGVRTNYEINDLRAWWVEQMVRTEAPLREQMTLFWHGHFTSATSKVLSLPQAFYQQNATWRKHALGNFREFIEAVTLDPCMLIYLDMEESDKSHPNENYARELLELFTLGVGNYTEKDILALARVLTGWTLDAPPGSVYAPRTTDPTRARSVLRDGLIPKFLPERHDDSEVTFLGRTGKFTLQQVLDIIVEHPACGRHLASRLIDYFGASDPDGALRERMAKAFRDSKYQIMPMLRELFTAPEFYAESARGGQIKSPVRLLVGAIRDLRLQGKITPAVAQLTVPMGQELFNPPNVKGWPGGKSWISASTLALRMRLGEVLVEGQELTGTEPLGRLRLTVLSRDPAQAAATTKRLLQIDAERREQQQQGGLGVRFVPERFADVKLAASPEKLVDELLQRMIVTRIRTTTRDAIVAACREVPEAQRIPLAARLILAAPEYQME
jgi:uncharacterized protein (DUF1800 family)